MKQLGLGLNLWTRKTRKREFLEELKRAVPWPALVQIVQPHYPKSKNGRPPFGIETMLRIHYLQQWFGLSDPAMEEARYDVPMYRKFAKLGGAMDRLPDETTILRLRHQLERNDLATDMQRVVNDILQAKGLMTLKGTVVDATLISAPSSIKNVDGERDPEMVGDDQLESPTTRKGNEWNFGMKAHIGVDAHFGLVHLVIGTAANVHDLDGSGRLLHGEEIAAFGDAGYLGEQRRGAAQRPEWFVAKMPGIRRQLNPCIKPEFQAEQAKGLKTHIRAKVEHPFRVPKRQFGYTKVRCRGLRKNTAQIITLFASSNRWMARRSLMLEAL